MLLSHLFPGQPVNSAGHEQCVEVNCCLYFDQTDLWLLLEHQHDPQPRKQGHARHWCCSLSPVTPAPQSCAKGRTLHPSRLQKTLETVKTSEKAKHQVLGVDSGKCPDALTCTQANAVFTISVTASRPWETIWWHLPMPYAKMYFHLLVQLFISMRFGTISELGN